MVWKVIGECTNCFTSLFRGIALPTPLTLRQVRFDIVQQRFEFAVLLNILDPNREVKPQFLSYVVALDSGRTLTGMIATETATSLTLRKPDNTTEAILRVNIEDIVSTGLSFMPEGLEKQLDTAAMLPPRTGASDLLIWQEIRWSRFCR